MQIGALKKQSTLYMWLGITGALILLIALAYAFLRYRLAVNKRRLAEKEAQRMEQEQHLVAVQATLDGETAERTRLAKDLHDGLGSMLSLVKFNLPQVKGDAVLEEMDVSRFRKALDMLDDSIQELRRVAHHMMPETLLRHGLKVSLSDFCAAIPNADFHYFGNGVRLPGKMEVMVYRCIHELVNNTLKHAQAGKINVQLVQEDHRVSFTVQDDGRGFDPQATHEGMGLRNIRQRVAAFMGKMEIYSTGEGTETHVELELDENGQYD
jgi:signal transduction histidine kinase